MYFTKMCVYCMFLLFSPLLYTFWNSLKITFNPPICYTISSLVNGDSKETHHLFKVAYKIKKNLCSNVAQDLFSSFSYCCPLSRSRPHFWNIQLLSVKGQVKHRKSSWLVLLGYRWVCVTNRCCPGLSPVPICCCCVCVDVCVSNCSSPRLSPVSTHLLTIASCQMC